MLELKSKKQLGQDAWTLADSFKLVRHRGVTYIPADFETREVAVTPDIERRMWMPMSREDIRRMAANQFQTLFGSDSELAAFDFMVAQNAQPVDNPVDALLVKTKAGLRKLDGAGQLVEVDGQFVPNTLVPRLNEDLPAQVEVYDRIVEWVNGEENATSLLHHLATALSPGYSAVKYVLLLGEGRNGKSVLLKMMHNIFGRDNVSSVTRQMISDQSPSVTELNGKLLNIVYDGRAKYLEDSGTEKSLVAGEPAPIRRLYESTPTQVQTNALFIEGLNKEPKSGDKSTALQKRLVRFQFPNVYPLDLSFEKKMLREESLGALLALLINHYVVEEKVAELLAPTSSAIELQLEHMYANSLALQYLKHVEETDTMGVAGLIGDSATELCSKFKSWRLKENDIGTWAESDVLALFQPLLTTDRKAVRVNGKPRKVRVITGLKAEAQAFIDTLEGEEDGAGDSDILDALVDAE